jgi:ribokinase
MAHSSVVVVGSANADLVVRCSRVPKPGETLLGSGFAVVPGGKGANQAVACSRLGARTRLIGRVGKDAFGDLLRATVAGAGVLLEHLAADADVPTGVALITVTAQGQNSIVVVPGANAHVTAQQVRSARKTIAAADAVLLQLEVPLGAVEAALDLARESGVLSVLDAGPAMKVPARILRKADIVSPNETEAQALTGVAVNSLGSARKAAGALVALGVKCAVLKLGHSGALLAVGGKMQHFPAVRVKPVDTTAAGDAFTAALTVRLAAGAEIADAVRFANCAGALATLTPGAQPSMPTLAALRRFTKTAAAGL